jgi:uncharacterized protein (TIRG00374 family)
MLRLIKFIVSGGLIAILVWNLEWEDLRSHATELDQVLILSAILLLSGQYPISAWKWQKSLQLHGINYPLGYLLRVLCIAFFFNNFLPTAIGGDAYRAYRTLPKSERPAYAISAVIVERIIGLIVLVAFGYVSAIILVINGSLPYKQTLILISGLVVFCGFLVWFAWRAGILIKLSNLLRSVQKLEPLFESVRVMKRNRNSFLELLALSFLFQAIAVIAIALIFAALGLSGRIYESAFTTAAAGLAGVIPLSVNGIGIVEGSFVVAAILANLPYAQSVVVALFLRIYGVVASILFGLLYLFDDNQDNKTLQRK